MTKAIELANARAELQQLRGKGYAAGHPNIDKLVRKIEKLEQEAGEESAAATPLGSPTQSAPPANPMMARAVKALDEAKADLKSLERQIENNIEAEAAVTKQIAEYQRRIEAAPMRDTELVELTRDYDMLSGMYRNLSGKRFESQISANVERRQIGEQFRILDPARLPEKPSSPNRQRMYMISIVLALIIGLGAAAVAVYLDRGLRSEDDVRLALALPVLATIPVIGLKGASSKRWKLMGASAAMVVLTGAAGAAWLVLR